MKVKNNSKVTVIAATKPSGTDIQLNARTDIRVAAYCRVSTGDESQQTSYTSQKAYYSNLIHSKAGWKFAGLYADEGISGTSIVRRTQFNQMIQDAKDGKIDYIVTKSISRFARNTLDTLTYVRELKELNPKVGIFFEKENIDTLDVRGEMVLTVLAAIAQEESHSISENIRWGIRKRFQAGIPQVNLNRLLGYSIGENGEWTIDEKQAEVVRSIYAEFNNGLSANAIARRLNEAEISTVLGNKWKAATVLNILRNEKYVGDVEMQKTFTKDFLSHSSEKNTGELPKFYIENHHVAIIGRDEWEKARERLGNRSRGRDRKDDKEKGILFGNVTCGADCSVCSAADSCRKNFYRLTYSAVAVGYTDERSLAATNGDAHAYNEEYMFSYPVWKHKTEKGGECCPLGAICEVALKQSFMEMLYSIKRDFEANGAECQICKLFRATYRENLKNEQERSGALAELSAINTQINILETSVQENQRKQAEAMSDLDIGSDDSIPEDSLAAVYADLVKDLQARLVDLRRSKAEIERMEGVTAEQKEHFEAFLKALLRLPTKNDAGMDIRVNGLDTHGSILRDADGHAKAGCRRAYNSGHLVITPERIEAAPDFLDFAGGIYRQYVVEGKAKVSKGGCEDGKLVKVDEIEYKTNFGLTITSKGNGRSLGSFLGFKRCGVGKDGKPDGTIEFISQVCKVDGGKIRYKRTEKK